MRMQTKILLRRTNDHTPRSDAMRRIAILTNPEMALAETPAITPTKNDWSNITLTS